MRQQRATHAFGSTNQICNIAFHGQEEPELPLRDRRAHLQETVDGQQERQELGQVVRRRGLELGSLLVKRRTVVALSASTLLSRPHIAHSV